MEHVAEEITVRLAKASDAEDIATLYEVLLGYHEDSRITAKALEAIYKEDNNFILAASINGKVIGTIQVSICNAAAFGGKPHAVIEYFVVDENYRRKKVGSSLMNEAEKICLSNNVSCIIIVSGDSRKEAHSFYKKMGYDCTVKGFRKDIVYPE